MSEIKYIALYENLVSQTISKLREEKGFSQLQFAARIGVSPSTWSRIENCESSLSIDQLRSAAIALEMPAHKLLEIVDSIEEQCDQLKVAANKKAFSIESVAAVTGLDSRQALGAAAGAAMASVIPLIGPILGAIVGSQLPKIIEKIKANE